ncbi:hypothetical protein F0310_03725 [Borrelia sp. A-FGy1]|uniref:hypothetical protein n=1 Tax=Borrelia sp. A-FGy1 TaxID=2608247 RepID=UPI0015F582AA|nr:hypothetical protein [Borrelia sp. A-FGy1]QMU99495.1 hypothetical protein F0310_03725 [Borrelia sp. A-FGy1]
MSDYKKAFFIKEGPREVDFDMGRIFLNSSFSGSNVKLYSDKIKEFLDEKLLELDSSLKKRHGELVNYLREVDVRISRVEEGIRYGLDSTHAFDEPNLKTPENLLSLNHSNSKFDNSFGEFSLRKENNLPNIAIDQEELDALLEGLNDISKDNKQTLSESDLACSLTKSSSDEEVSGIDFNASGDISFHKSLEEGGGNEIENLVKAENENTESLNISCDLRKESNLLDGKSSFALDNAEIDAISSLDVDSDDISFSYVDLGGDSSNKTTDGEKIEKQEIEKQEGNRLEELDFYLNESFNEVKFSDQNLKLLNKEEKNESLSSKELAILDEVSISEVSNNKNESNESVYNQKKEINDVFSFKDLGNFDNFEDVLKTDLNCSDLQKCVEGYFEEENLYDNKVDDLEDKLGQSEKVNLYSKGQTEDNLRDNLSTFSFAEVERIINKFDDNEYLSKIGLSSEERIVLVKFIDKLEGDLEFSPRVSSFKIRREYEILQKIKRLLVRE